MSLSQQFKNSEQKVGNGVSIEFPMNDDGSIPTFVVKPANKSNKQYQKALELLFRPHQRAMQLKTFSNDKAGEILQQVFIQHALVGWSNVMKSDVTGNPADEGFAEYSNENAKKLFTNLPDLFDELQAQASDNAMFRNGTMEQSAGN